MKTVSSSYRLGIGLFFVVAAFASAAGTRHWRGTVNEVASNSANWVDERGYVAPAPDVGDDIVLDAGSAGKPMTWDIGETVGSWTQTADYTGTVTFMTGRNGRAQTTDWVAYGETDPSGDKWFVVTGDVSIQGGTWTHPVQPAFNNTDAACADGRGIWRLLVKVGGSMQIGESAKIDVTANGFLKGTGPGRSTSSDCGASHGGRGTAYSSEACKDRCPRDCYGSVKFPRTLGSGGNNSSGGGSVELVVTGALTLDGAIRADGNDYNYGTTTVQQYHAPAGGSVFVTAGSLAGRGFISADGATCTGGGCGGGGRVAVKLMGAGATFETFSKDHVSAAGKWSAGTTSFCGPLYFETPADDGEGELVVRGTDATMAQIDYSINYVLSTQLKDPTDDYTFSRIVLSNSAVLGFESNVVVKAKALVSENATVNTNQLAFKGGRLQLGGDAAVSNVWVRLYRPGFPFAFAAGGSEATTFGPETYVDARVPVDFPGDLTLARGTRVVQPVNGSKFNYRVDLSVAGDLTVEEGAIIDATACGYKSNVGHGPNNLGLGNANTIGGSHGGLSRGTDTAVCYGSITEPDEPGAGCRSTGGVQLNGGGVVRLRVTGATRVNGRIAADGKSHTYMGGAGGSVFLRTGSISGSGVISADGGSSGSGGWYPGGGGRVAVCLGVANADFSSGPTITAYGGKLGTTTFAGAGTVYLETAAEGAGGGRLVVDASNALVKNATVQQTVIGPEVTGDQVGSVVVTNAAKLYLDSGRTLSVSGDWLNSAMFASAPGGTVRFVGPGAARICGVNDFANLTCTEPGKTLRFGTDGSRLNIISGGTLTLSGGETSALVLDREGETGRWPLALAPGSSMALTFLDVSNSDARFGAVEAFATDSTGRGNEGWTIVGRIEPGATITWTGVASDSWTLKDNWDLGRLPVATDRLVIGPSENPPRLSGDVTAGRLTVLSGATLYLAGSALSVTDGLACAGTMVFVGTERLQVAGDVNLGGATFTGAPSVVDYVCDGTRTANFGDVALGKVTVSGAGALAVTGGFSASDVILSAAEALTLSVSPGVTVATTDFHADGGDAVALRLWGEEGPWTLGVSRLAVAVGVSVSNCVATGSRDLTADAPSQDCGGNVRWRFPADGVAVWTGGASGSYEDPDGWSGKTVPGVDAHVQIPAGSTVTAARRVAMRQLTLEGSLVCGAGFEVAESAVVQPGGVLSSDRPSSVGVLLMLQSGAKLTHAENGSTEVNKLELTVGGDMIVEAGASIDVNGKGYSSGGPGVGIDGVSAGSYGGRGACWVPDRENEIMHCYGSVFAPVNLGSAYGSKTCVGGGAVRLEVGGTLQIDGMVEADGLHTHNSCYSGSGGSIYLRAAAIVGAGGMSANGGTFTTDCGGAGGRIALYQTVAADFSGFTGTVEAHGGHKTDTSGTLYDAQGAAGTIYRQSAGDRPGAGTITVNAWDASIGSRNQYTELPIVGVGGDDKHAYREATVSLERKGVLGLTGDLTVGELELPAGTELRLYGHRLRVRSMRHLDGRGWEGTVTLGGGSIVWGDRPTPVSYRAWNETTRQMEDCVCTNCTVVTSSTATFEDGKWYVVTETVECGSIAVNGEVHLILCDGAKLTATAVTNEAGIAVAAGNSLTIYGQQLGTGELVAKNKWVGAGYAGACIGGVLYDGCGTVTINGGTITAISEGAGAGIGGAWGGSCGSIIINGGKITAKGNNAAGIGDGGYGRNGKVTINGGTVGASQGYSEADIGFGKYGSGTTVTINGGNVKAATILNAPTNSANAAVYCVSVEGLNGGTLKIEGLGDYGTQDIVPIDGKVYLYLPNGTHVFTVDGVMYRADVKDAATTASIYTEPTCEGGEIAEGEDGVWVVTPEAGVTEISVANLPAGAIAAVPPTVTKVNGVADEQIKVRSGAVDITGAFTVTGGEIALNPNGAVTIGGETIPVKPTIGDLDEGEPFTVGKGAVMVAVKAIPGLRYALVRGETVEGCRRDGGSTEEGGGTVIESVVATGTRVALSDANPPAGKAFYIISVSCPAAVGPSDSTIRIVGGRVYSGQYDITDAVTILDDGTVELKAGGVVGGVKVTPVIGDLPPSSDGEEGTAVCGIITS